MLGRNIWFYFCFASVGEIRAPGDSGNQKGDANEDDRVELEKSNILLMGPTGSGKLMMS